jgi:hypothetical protein
LEVAATEGATEVATEVGALAADGMGLGVRLELLRVCSVGALAADWRGVRVRLELLDVARDAPGGAIS